MAIKKIKSLDGAGEVVRDDLIMTNAEAGVVGKAYVVTSGKLTAAATDVRPQYIGRKTTAAATPGVATEVTYVRNDDLFECPYTTSGSGVPVVGTKTYDLNSTLTGVDADTATGGLTEIVSVNTTDATCVIKFN